MAPAGGVCISPMRTRGTSSANIRGSSYDRRRRREHLLKKHASPTGKTIPCYHCGSPMRVAAGRWEVDRWPVCGHAGGRYTLDNIVPSCRRCNKRCASVKGCPLRRKS